MDKGVIIDSDLYSGSPIYLDIDFGKDLNAGRSMDTYLDSCDYMGSGFVSAMDSGFGSAMGSGLVSAAAMVSS